METLIEQIKQKLKNSGVPADCERPLSGVWKSVKDEIAGAQKVTDSKELAAHIDHTLLKPEADRQGIIDLCRQAAENEFCSVCINPYWLPLAKENLRGSAVKLCTVCGFPLGADDPALKSDEARKSVEQGADEVDMVINIGALRSGLYREVFDDIAGVVKAAGGKTVKVIIETCLLTQEQKIEACLIARGAGAHFVKTSTGFSSGGATIEDITLMRQTVGPDLGVKASGGVKTAEDAMAMIKAGANRIGTSSGVKIIGK
ncbi:MAG: deoxyribose-phosphate aldolase [Candidatus Edwardsbacteria bacterium]|nr:deoxyribose-phosphate aldolase [Candidatus Edwardsbacteria bacterium]MBU1576445.1 deoxyribose-phosphate aldolase [Candidatus Edwardsbacteria bacterium]MBU2464062.1 deoxyribose-phosphate aldolase [Candidatus Edwardsbacteria bacterium]MBU2594518.1 deoxyribose-phosphate aldolase [Candidatus Edwardsbacteria bacterium]